MSKQTKAIEKCRKLLAMAKDSSSENESEIAMRQLHSFLVKYGIGMEEITDDPNDIAESDELVHSCHRAWSRGIASSIAELYFCRLLVHRDAYKQSEGYTFIGEELHRLIAKDIAEMAIQQVNRESNRKAREHGCGQLDYSFRTSFRNAARSVIASRCHNLIVEAKKGQLVDPETGSNLPALINTYETKRASIDQVVEAMSDVGKMRASRTRSSNYEGHSAGQEEGAKISLRKGMAKVTPKQLTN